MTLCGDVAPAQQRQEAGSIWQPLQVGLCSSESHMPDTTGFQCSKGTSSHEHFHPHACTWCGGRCHELISVQHRSHILTSAEPATRSTLAELLRRPHNDCGSGELWRRSEWRRSCRHSVSLRLEGRGAGLTAYWKEFMHVAFITMEFGALGKCCLLHTSA